jgi:hypothetical protein
LGKADGATVLTVREEEVGPTPPLGRGGEQGIVRKCDGWGSRGVHVVVGGGLGD